MILQNAPWNLVQIINIYSIIGQTGLQNHCDTTQEVVWIRCLQILQSSKDLLEYTQPRSLSSCNSIWLLYSLHNYSPLKLKKQAKRTSPTVLHKKERLA